MNKTNRSRTLALAALLAASIGLAASARAEGPQHGPGTSPAGASAAELAYQQLYQRYLDARESGSEHEANAAHARYQAAYEHYLTMRSGAGPHDDLGDPSDPGGSADLPAGIQGAEHPGDGSEGPVGSASEVPGTVRFPGGIQHPETAADAGDLGPAGHDDDAGDLHLAGQSGEAAATPAHSGDAPMAVNAFPPHGDGPDAAPNARDGDVDAPGDGPVDDLGSPDDSSGSSENALVPNHGVLPGPRGQDSPAPPDTQSDIPPLQAQLPADTVPSIDGTDSGPVDPLTGNPTGPRSTNMGTPTGGMPLSPATDATRTGPVNPAAPGTEDGGSGPSPAAPSDAPEF